MAPIVINNGSIVKKPAICEQAPNNKRSEATSVVFNRSLHQDPLIVTSSKGNYLVLSNGQRIFDATGGAAVACLGHDNERVRAAVVSQMTEVSYCHSLLYRTQVAEDLARLLIDTTYGEMARVFVISSGSEAMEAAIKLARQYHLEKSTPEPDRTHFIARQQSYHGTTLGALAVGGHVARRALYEPIMSINSSRVSPCYIYRGAETITDERAYVRKLEAELDAEFQRVGPHRIAAFVAEPVVGAALGCVSAVSGYFQAVRKICDKYGALLILDEVMCGIGRIGPEPSTQYPEPLHAWQDPLVGIVPDIMTLGKGLGGGYMPVAAALANHKVVDALKAGTGAFSHGQTYQGHPLACRAALEVQRIIAEHDLVNNVRTQGSLLGKLLKEKLSENPTVGDIRGKGLFWGIEFVKNKATKEPFDAREGVALGVHELGLQPPYNISLYPGNGCADGYRGDQILLAPAYNVSEADVRHIVDTTEQVIKQYFRRYRAQLF